MVLHILPNVASPLLVATTLSVGGVILTESVLRFLGLGIQPPTPSWGNMLSNAQELITTTPSLAFYPGACIFATVVACNLIGDWLQQRLREEAMLHPSVIAKSAATKQSRDRRPTLDCFAAL